MIEGRKNDHISISMCFIVKNRWDFFKPIRYLSLFKTNCLIDRGVCYEKNISYCRTYKLNIIADKMKNKNKNTTLSDIVQNLIEKYHTVEIVQKSNRKIPHCRK
jgi:hypothetical protein